MAKDQPNANEKVELHFETLQFRLRKDTVQINLLKIFRLHIPTIDLKKIGEFSIIDNHTIAFFGVKEKKASIQFAGLLDKYLPTLVNTVSHNQATYIHRGSGIPLIGSVSFGIVYRNSSIVEIKPITSCNLSCVYCSVKEGVNSGKRDVVVEMEYLLEELEKLLLFIDESIEVHIGVQGEPFLYSDMTQLIEKIQDMDLVHTISMDTNLTLVTKQMVDRLEKCSKLRFNISLDSMDIEDSRRIAGAKSYNLNYVLDMIRYIASSRLNYLIAPVYVPGFNDDELPKIIEFVKSLPERKIKSGEKVLPKVCIQNYLPYKSGRRPVKKPATWDSFYAMLDELEKKYDIQLRINSEDFKIRNTKELPVPFHVDDEIRAVLVGRDRFAHTCLASARERVISIPNCDFVSGKKIKLRIIRDKHNIFTGKLV